jgi:hypothetical protein
MHPAQFYMQESQKPRSNDFFVIFVLFAYSTYHGADDYGKQRVRGIMRYLLSGELILTLLSNDKLPLWMLVVRIMVLTCAFFNEELIPTLTKMLWTMVYKCAQMVWQWLREQWPHVRQYLAQQWMATERGRSETQVQRARSRSPDGRPSSQLVEQENHEQILLTNGKNHSEERGHGVGLYLSDGDASSQAVEQENTPQLVPVNERSENDHIVQENTGKPVAPNSMTSTEILRAEWGRNDVERKRKNAERLAKKKRKRDENLTPESERAGKKPRT